MNPILAAVWDIVRRPWCGWLAFAIALIFCFRHPGVITTAASQSESQEHTVTKYVDSVKLKLVGLPGSKTILHPDGSIEVDGPVNVDYTRTQTGTSVSDEKTTTSSTTVTKPAVSDWSASAGALFSRSSFPTPAYYAAVDRRILGPFALEAMASTLPSVGVGVRMTF